MTLHSRWTSGTLEFYDGTQTVFIIPLTDGTMAIGEDGEGIDVKFYGDTASSYLIWDESGDRLNGYYADFNFYGSDGVKVLAFDSSLNILDFSGINITYNDPDVTVADTTGTITLGSTSNRIQCIPVTATGDSFMTLPNSSGYAGVEFKIFNTASSGYNLVVNTTAGGTLVTLLPKYGAVCISDGASSGWRVLKGSSGA